MPCFYPMQGVRTTLLTSKGKPHIQILARGSQIQFGNDNPNLINGIPCGQCVGCRLERSRQWAIRCVHEAQLHEENCFITLTFNEESLQKRENPLSLDKKEFPDFMKRFRRRISDPDDEFFHPLFSELLPIEERKVLRYYMCGEYGERFKRPHYHAIIFGYDFPDRKLEEIKDGYRYYSSQILRTLWPFGHNRITDVSFDTCAYVARYIMKKHLGKDALLQYCQYIDEETGEIVGLRIPEYTTMSRRSGIGKEWLDKYLIDVYPRDKVFMRGKGFSKPPKYYDTLFEVINPSGFASIKQARIESALQNSSDNTPDRLHAKQVVKLAQISNISRKLE